MPFDGIFETYDARRPWRARGPFFAGIFVGIWIGFGLSLIGRAL